MAEQHEVIVVGAGPAGSATALRLAALGHQVRLIDRERFPRDKACAEYLTPATLRQLELLPGAPAFPPWTAKPIEATRVLSPRGWQVTGALCSAGGQAGQAIPRQTLDAALVSAATAAGAVLEQGRVIDLLRSDSRISGVLIERPDGTREALPSRVVVGADGLHSMVARRTGMHRQGRLRRISFTAHLAGVNALSSTAEMHVSEQGYLGINRLGEDLANVSLVVPQAHSAAARGDSTGFFWNSIGRFGGVADRVRHARVVRQVMVTGPFHVSCKRAVGNGFLLAGDAAEFFDPFTGDGIHSALTGATLAAAALHLALQEDGPVTAAQLRGYQQERLKVFGGTWLLERLIGYSIQAPRLFDRAVARLDRRGMGNLLLAATGHETPVWRVLNPYTLARILA